MPITQSAKKALRQSKRRKIVNLKRKDAMKDFVKQIKKLKVAGKKDEVAKLVPLAYKAIDKAAKGGVIKKQTAARKKSQVAKASK